MATPMILALVATLVQLGTMTYFLMGSAPLLILKHESPVDSRVVRGFFATYYRVLGVVSVASAVGYAGAGLSGLAVGAIVLALAAAALHRAIVPRMDALRVRLEAGRTADAVASFRRWHVLAILVNLALLVATVVTLARTPVDLT